MRYTFCVGKFFSGMLLLFVGLIFGFYVGRFSNLFQTKIISPLSSTPIQKVVLSPTQTAGTKLKTIQMQIAEDYFSSFTNCLKHPPAEAVGNVFMYCQLHNKFVGKNLPYNMKGKYAPVVCGQNQPLSVSANSSSGATDSAMLVTLKYSYGSTSQHVVYQIQKEGESWKVENIICPKPS